MEVGYLEGFSKIWDHCWIEWNKRGPAKTFLTDFVHELSSYGFISVKDIFFCLVLGVAFTILRYFLTAAIFKVRLSLICFLNSVLFLKGGSFSSWFH